MLPAAARLHTSGEFGEAIRRGGRGSTPTMVVHLHIGDRADGARAGFVVSKKVGNSVVRHRVTRRLRALVRPRLAELPGGSDLVIRALPAAAAASSATLGDDLTRALRHAQRHADRRRRPDSTLRGSR